VSLIRGGGRGWISTNLQEGEAFYPVGAAPAEDLPNPVMPEASMEAVCDPHMTFSESFNIPTHGDTVHTTIDLGDKSPPRPVDLEGRIIHVTAAGTICTLGYVLQRQDLRVALYHDKTSSYFGWVFRTPADFKDRLAAPVTCTTAP
jgi:hypothetical protein